MSKTCYHPGRGDIIHVNFSRSELALPDCELVIGTQQFSRHTGLRIVLRMTTNHEKRI